MARGAASMVDVAQAASISLWRKTRTASLGNEAVAKTLHHPFIYVASLSSASS
jgi:hypothetical protein